MRLTLRWYQFNGKRWKVEPYAPDWTEALNRETERRKLAHPDLIDAIERACAAARQ